MIKLQKHFINITFFLYIYSIYIVYIYSIYVYQKPIRPCMRETSFASNVALGASLQDHPLYTLVNENAETWLQLNYRVEEVEDAINVDLNLLFFSLFSIFWNFDLETRLSNQCSIIRDKFRIIHFIGKEYELDLF